MHKMNKKVIKMNGNDGNQWLFYIRGKNMAIQRKWRNISNYFITFTKEEGTLYNVKCKIYVTSLYSTKLNGQEKF